MEVVCGLDVGTSGAKALAVDRQGKVVARAERKFSNPPYQPAPGLAEQNAEEWWDTACLCLQQLTQQLGPTPILAIAIDSTSGTFVPVDQQGTPLAPALMYNDNRAQGLEGAVNEAAGEFTERLGYTFPSSFSLVKLLWLLRNRPDLVQATYKFLHAADFLVGKLTGHFDCTDTSNALKSGVDLLTGDWPAFIQERLALPLDKLPRVVKPGDRVGEVSAEAAAQTGIKAGTPVVAGASDGTASFLASGAKAVGDWALNIGTTITIRGLSQELIRDPQGRLYCHRHPEGYWLPGGASNVGGEGLVKTFGSRIGELDQPALACLPSALIVYPLVRRGERMPFISNHAEGFVVGTPQNDAELFAAYVQGIALVTAWSVQEAAALGAPTNGDFYLAGGGAHGKTLSLAMASVFGSPLIVAQEPDATMGSALLAAGWVWYAGSVSAAQAAMVEAVQIIEPVNDLLEPLQEKLEALKHQCKLKGYL